jgi:hypothetical protein
MAFRGRDPVRTKIVIDIYTQNKILIKFNNKLSKSVKINKEVRQGCPL